MNLSRKQLFRLLCVLLGGFTLLVYLPVTRHPFVAFDDNQYIQDNAHVRTGLSWANVGWAFRSGYACNWHPLTWISHMADCQLYGLNAGGHHFTNVLFHAANTILLFILLTRLTGALWPSVFVAGFFGWHPLHVESVAWASERKDVLCGFFFLLTSLAYASSCSRRAIAPNPALSGPTVYPASAESSDSHSEPGTARTEGVASPFGNSFYYLAILFFALALMSKPMAVTLPFVLLLLDFWPLERWSFGSVWRQPDSFLKLVAEKLPFFALAVATSIITFLVQKRGGATGAIGASLLPSRFANMVVAYARYLGKTFWPSDLAAVYPLRGHLPLTLAFGVGLLLVVVTVVCLLLSRRHRFIFTGWFWFLGMLVPVIGLVQVGAQSMADRYMYLPSIGIFIMVVWGLLQIQQKLGLGDLFLSGAGLVAVSMCLLCTALQLRTWESTETLARRAIEVVPDNYVGYSMLGKALDDEGQKKAALFSFSKACQINPYFPEAQFNYATLLFEFGSVDEAILHFQAALKEQVGYVNALHGLGNALLSLGRLSEAETKLALAAKLAPENADVHHSLGTVLLHEKKLHGAEAEFLVVLRLNPNHVQAWQNLGIAFAEEGRVGEALSYLGKAVELAPQDPDLRFNYGLALTDKGDFASAEKEFRAGTTLRPEETRFHYRLAVCLSREGKIADAEKEYRATLELAPDFNDAKSELSRLVAGSGDARGL